jgi:hypothetical protein
LRQEGLPRSGVHVANTLNEVVFDGHVGAGHVCRRAVQDALKLLHPRSLHSTVLRRSTSFWRCSTFSWRSSTFTCWLASF